MEQLTYGGSNKNSIFNGVQYYAKNAEVGDSITFQVVDKDGTGVTLGLYPQAYYDAYKDGNGVLVIEEFGDSWYVAPNTMEDIILYESTIYPGLYLRSSYTSTGTGSDPEFMLNLYRHLVE